MVRFTQPGELRVTFLLTEIAELHHRRLPFDIGIQHKGQRTGHDDQPHSDNQRDDDDQRDDEGSSAPVHRVLALMQYCSLIILLEGKYTKIRIGLGGALVAVLVGCLATPAMAETASEPDVIDTLNSVADATRELDTGALTDVLGGTADIPGGAAITTIDDVRIEVPASPTEPVVIGEGDSAVGIHRPGEPVTGVSELQNGVSAHEVVGGEVVTAVKEDSTLQIATVLNDETAPERFDYSIDIPEGARIELVNGQPFVWAADGSMIGGFFPAWAVDATGESVPTRYELAGDVLTQVVEHHSTEATYPIVADPAYRRGMISQVKWERWANGGWEIRLTVTALARATQPINPAIVYTEGLRDLREHHPRGMEKKTMAQQWDCHVIGLPGTINIDLESYRRSWDGWRAGIIPSVLQGNPAKACNW